MISLNTAFKKVYGELLEPYGFKKAKGRNPYFVRMVGDEIVHVITCVSRPTSRRGYKEFDVLGGVATVYRDKINIEETAANNFIWLNSILSHHRKSPLFAEKKDMFEKWYRFSYLENDEESLIKMIEYTAELTRYIILPIVDRVFDMECCYNYFKIFNMGLLCLNTNEFKKEKTYEHDEGILYTKLFNAEQFKACMERLYDKYKIEQLTIAEDISNEYSMQDYEKNIKIYYEDMIENIDIFKKLISEQTNLEKLFEKRKKNNILLLKKYGINADMNNLERLSNMTHPDKIVIPEELL